MAPLGLLERMVKYSRQGLTLAVLLRQVSLIAETPVLTPESSSMPTSSASNQDAPENVSAQNKPMGCLGSLFLLIFRLVLLTAGGGVALFAGMAIATVYPAQVENPPVLETVLQRVNTLLP